MSEATADLAIPADPYLEALEEVAAMLEWPLPRERSEAVCAETARVVDKVLAPVARGRGAVDVAIGDGLDALDTGDRVLRLGYSGIGDYARERLGIAASTALKMARLARELRDRPLLRAAVRSGEVSVRQAEAVLPLARGDAEEAWVLRARMETVRALKAVVKAPDAPGSEEDEKWDRISIPLSAEERPEVDEAVAIAGKILGAGAWKAERFVAISEEWLGAYWSPRDGNADEPPPPASAEECMEPIKETLEKESAQWAFLGQPQPVPAPEPSPDVETDPWLLDKELRRFSGMRKRWDGLFGHLALVFRSADGWRFLGFASLEHYCVERLGMSERTVQQRISLERRLHDLPSLRQAMRDGRVSYEKARLVARHADRASVDGLIERAERMTCIALRRELEAKDEVQMCARGRITVIVPRRVQALLGLAFRAARRLAGRWLSPGECLRMMAAHFIEVWKPVVSEPSTLQKKILARDGGFCQVPGCSRAAAHVHHIEFRSAGGTNEPTNLVSLCAGHHLRGVHMGFMRVRGKAPGGLHWQLGIRPNAAPLVDVVSA